MTSQPTRAEVARVEQELEHTAAEITALPRPALEALAPVLAQAQREAASALREWRGKVNGDSRYTAQEHRAVLARLERAIETVRTINPTLSDTMTRAGRAAGALAARHVAMEIASYARAFGGEVPRVSIHVARIVATGERALVPRFRASAARYAGQIGADLRRELAVGIVRRETVSQMVDRLARLGGPRGPVALRGIAQEPGAQIEHIVEGLFTRYRYWGERLVRTETQAAYNLQVDRTLREARPSIPDLMRRWDASADLRLCRRCAEMHGQIAEVGGPFPNGVTEAPLHPNCRCRVGAWRREWSELLRRTDGGDATPWTPPPGARPPRKPPPPAAPTTPTPQRPPAPDARRPFPESFATHVEAETWATAEWPHIFWDLEGVHHELAHEALDEFRRLAADFPEVMRRLRYVGTYARAPSWVHVEEFGRATAHSEGGANAHFRGEKMGLNPAWWARPTAFRALKRQSFTLRWSTGYRPAHTITHEFGHLVDSWLRQAPISPFGAQEFGTLGDILADFQRSNHASNALSTQALKNADEAFAEAFVRMRDPGVPRALWDAYTQRLEALIAARRESVPVDSLPSLRAMNESDRLAANAHADAVLDRIEGRWRN